MLVSDVEEVVVRPCVAGDVSAITATKHPGARIAERSFARRDRGESLYLTAWFGGVPAGQGEVVREPGGTRREGLG